ncbi:MAG: lysylphosphatidylglycerol synthase transmembrane domain-containing protein [Chloroflexota bacterium]
MRRLLSPTVVIPAILSLSLLAALLALFLLVVWAVHRRYHRRPRPRWVADHPIIGKLLNEFKQFRAGAVSLMHPRVLSRAAVLGACYVVLGGSVLFLVVRGLGFDSVSYGEVVAVYCFSVAFALIFPLPVDIGVYEASGTGAFLAVGLSRSDAVSAMVLTRLLTSGTAVVVALVAIIVLRDQIPAILHDRSHTNDIDRAHYTAEQENP